MMLINTPNNSHQLPVAAIRILQRWRIRPTSSQKFEAAFEAFKTTDERPTDLYVAQIYDATAKIFYPIRYGSVGARHNLMGLIDDNTSYATE